MTHKEMVRAAQVIHTFGVPGKYYSLTKIYPVSPDGECRWWTEANDFADTTLVNGGTTRLSYGVQNAPSTVTGVALPYDELAAAWDCQHQPAADEAECVQSLLAQYRGMYPPHVLDLGCGTGRVLDLRLASQDRYAAVDSSQAMLNMLVRKHPRVAAFYPMDVGQALASGLFSPGRSGARAKRGRASKVRQASILRRTET